MALTLPLASERIPAIEREHGDDRTVLLWEGGRERLVDWRQTLGRDDLDGLIRLRLGDHMHMPTQPGRRRAVANRQLSRHLVGQRYGVVRIRRHGWFVHPGAEQQPLLELTPLVVATCIACREQIAYADILPREFRLLPPQMRTPASLQATLLSRYQESLPGVPPVVIVQAGVSITTLEVLTADA